MLVLGWPLLVNLNQIGCLTLENDTRKNLTDGNRPLIDVTNEQAKREQGRDETEGERQGFSRPGGSARGPGRRL